ncbi:MAG: hypothetical protein SVT56_04660 [Chloroflexota bacterium]|nr:hypothetical protein [Chloroflexota bacterium]
MLAIFLMLPMTETDRAYAQSESTCLNRVHVSVADPHWTYAPENPNELHTEEDLFFLAGQLILNDIVDASECPANGLTFEGYANACGMEVAKPAAITLQNMLNESILEAYEIVGVPPVLLKQLIRVESQFWPSKYETYHYGYGHITNVGIRNALQWNTNLSNKACSGPDYQACATSVGSASQILNSLINTCETCEYGIAASQTDRSVDILAETLLGYCYQTEQLILNATGWHSSLAVDYGTMWKLTLMDYNAGSKCVYNTIESTFQYTNGPMSWSEIAAHVSDDACFRGLTYANQITTKVFDFPPDN